MPLTPFLTELRHELKRAEPDFAEWLGVLRSTSATDPAFVDAMDAYHAQIDRVGQTAGMIGMHGLATWVTHLLNSLAGVSALGEEGRQAACTHLAGWPRLADAYLTNPADFDASLTITEFLAASELPQALTDVQCISLIEKLAAPPEIPEELLAELTASEAPTTVTEADVSLVLGEDMDMDVYNAFMDEAPAKVDEFSQLTHKIAQGSSTPQDMQVAKRLAHSFKGSANIVGIRGIAALGHYTEDVLEYFEQNPVKPPRALARTLVDASDCLAQMLAHLQGEEEAPVRAYEVLTALVEWANKVKSGEIAEMSEADDISVSAPSAVASESAEPFPPSIPAPARPASADDAVANLRVPVTTVDELFRLVGELNNKIGRLEDRVKGATEHAKGLLTQNASVQQRVMDLEKLVAFRGLSINKPSADSDDSAFDPLELDRYNELHGATRALVEVTADAREIATSIEDEIAGISGELSQQVQVGRDLQHHVISTRMTPVSALFGRLTRNVRQTCQQTGKEAELVITGGDILVDGDVLNKLADPLLHVLRNAVDHGIETPEARRDNGKPPVGVVNLDFVRQGTSVVVKIKDDGRGLDYERIRDKAIARGLITAGAGLTQAELARLTLLAGFSTRDAVNEISGRGVGMDVVSSRLAELKGSVDLRSEPNQGCEVVLRLQASLVTQQCLLVESAMQTFAIPIHDIVQALAPGLGAIVSAEDGWKLILGTEQYAVHTLATLTGARELAATQMSLSALPAVLVRTGEGTVAIIVDRVVSTRDLIVKGLGRYLPKVYGIAGASLLGDGSVVPLLNVPELLFQPIAVSSAAEELAEAARRQVRRVLVVDDSVSVRKSLTQLLQDAAFEVVGAGDGLEAIHMLDSFKPHVVCTDLEMPNMNGLELTQHLRRRDDTTTLPIIMITSRSMDKHRDQAKSAGVDYYVTKPYTDAELLKIVHKAIAEGGKEEAILVAA